MLAPKILVLILYNMRLNEPFFFLFLLFSGFFGGGDLDANESDEKKGGKEEKCFWRHCKSIPWDVFFFFFTFNHCIF